MKRFLLKFGVFCVVAFVLYCSSITILNSRGPDFIKKNLKYHRGSYGHMFTRLREADTTANVDILVIGSSHAYRGFDTRQFQQQGFKVFNFGSSAQTPIQTEYLLKRYADQLKPKLVIWDLWPNTFCIDGVESMTDLISNSENPLELKEMVFGINSVVGYNTFAVGMIKKTLGSDKDFKEKQKKGGDLYIKGGFVERKIEFLKVPKPGKPNPKIFLEEQKEAFENALEFLRSKNIGVLLVQAPYTKIHKNSISNREEISDFFEEYTQRGLASKYIDFNEDPNLKLEDSLDFYDLHHMNQNGVVKFNTILLKDPLLQEFRNNAMGYDRQVKQ